MSFQNLGDAEPLSAGLQLSIMEGLDTLDPKGFQNASHEERRMSISVTKKIIQHYLNDHSHHQLDLPHRSSRFEKSAQGQKVLKSSLAAVRALTRKQRCMQEDFRCVTFFKQLISHRWFGIYGNAYRSTARVLNPVKICTRHKVTNLEAMCCRWSSLAASAVLPITESTTKHLVGSDRVSM